jgi:carbamoyltransferase
MIICGLKLTHDGAIALIDNASLIFSIEMEKIDNNLRYTSITDTSLIEKILNDNGYSVNDIDHFVIDGWGGTDQDALALQPRLEIGPNHNYLLADNNGLAYKLGVAAYKERTLESNILESWSFQGLKIGDEDLSYSSFLHVTGHVLSAYCTSPFAEIGASSYILVWDGGMYPGLYYFDAIDKKIKNLGPLFLLIGNIYTIFSQHFGPFKVSGNFAKDDLSVAGKVMAYIALGKTKEELFDLFDEIIESSYDKPMGFANIFANAFMKRIDKNTYSDEDILCTFHSYLEKLLVSKLKKKIERFDFNNRNLCIAGGCALNIKWNSAIRNCGFFKDVYVPPFPNDSGSAVGVASAKLLSLAGISSLTWNVYSGPALRPSSLSEGWMERPCSVEELAFLLHTTNEPVIFLGERAELGPRALGNRSIIAAPVSPFMKNILNKIKDRESYRPVSPICIEEKAPVIFSPGSKDPFMLFDHTIHPAWRDKIPAVMHLDGSARLQTVSKQSNAVVYQLLAAYESLSGIPLLCNTSANYKGTGFFPDVYSATKWNRVNYVWCNNVVFEKEKKISFDAFTSQSEINQQVVGAPLFI